MRSCIFNEMLKTSCRLLVKEYCSNSTFAGIRFIADDTKHWTERLLWVALVFLSWFGSVLLMVSAWQAFVSNPISFGVDTIHKDWETKLPAIAVCESINQPKIFNVTDGLWTSKHAFDLDDFVKDIVYFRGMSYNLVEKCHHNKKPHPECDKVLNFTYFVDLVRSKCPEMIKNCSYNHKPFECCEYFQSIETDMGLCFIINSIQIKRPKPYPMVCNMKEKHGVLKFELLVKSTVYTLGEDEIPTITTLQSSSLSTKLGEDYRRLVSIRNIENDPLVVLTTPEQRACRFHDENENGIYPYYSYSACTLRCRKQNQMKFCGCNDHLMVATVKIIKMEEAFEDFKKHNMNSIEGLTKWLQGIKLIDKTKDAEDRVQNLFNDVSDVKNVELPKFIQVVNTLAEEKHKTFSEVSKALVEEAPKFTNAFKAGISTIKDLFKRQ